MSASKHQHRLSNFSPRPWHGRLIIFQERFQHFSFPCPANLFVAKPSRPSDTICPRSSTQMYDHTFCTINNNGSCSLQHIHSNDHGISIWLCLMHHSMNWYVWRICVSTSLFLRVNQLEVYILFCLADREGNCHMYNVAQYRNT